MYKIARYSLYVDHKHVYLITTTCIPLHSHCHKAIPALHIHLLDILLEHFERLKYGRSLHLLGTCITIEQQLLHLSAFYL